MEKNIEITTENLVNSKVQENSLVETVQLVTTKAQFEEAQDEYKNLQEELKNVDVELERCVDEFRATVTGSFENKKKEIREKADALLPFIKKGRDNGLIT